jgi:hypothetical protein
MGAAIASAERIRQAFGGVSLLLVHHAGKDQDRGARGHSSLVAAVDGSFEVKDGELVVRKARDGKAGEAFAFELRPIELGQDEDGDPVVAVVATATDAPMANKARAPMRLADGSKVALRALRDLLKERGVGVAGLNAPQGTLAIRLSEWREVHQSRYGGSSADSSTTGAERQAWKRALGQLQAASIVTVHGEWVWANDRKPSA